MAKPLFYIEDVVLVSARNLQSAKAWYQTAFGCSAVSEDEDGNIVLTWKDQPGGGCVVIGPPFPQEGDSPVPIVFTRDLEKAHAVLREKGVDCGALQADAAGMRFFEFRDIEGNLLEMCAG